MNTSKILHYNGPKTTDYDQLNNLGETILISDNHDYQANFYIAKTGLPVEPNSGCYSYRKDAIMINLKKTKSGLRFYYGGKVIGEVSEDKVFDNFKELYDILAIGIRKLTDEKHQKLEKSTDLIDKYFLALSKRYEGCVYDSGSWQINDKGQDIRVKTIGMNFHFVKIYLYYYNQNIYLAVNGLQNGIHYYLSLADPNNDPLKIVYDVIDSFNNVEKHLRTQWSTKGGQV